jgi:hypothetical protein
VYMGSTEKKKHSIFAKGKEKTILGKTAWFQIIFLWGSSPIMVPAIEGKKALNVYICKFDGANFWVLAQNIA